MRLKKYIAMQMFTLISIVVVKGDDFSGKKIVHVVVLAPIGLLKKEK